MNCWLRSYLEAAILNHVTSTELRERVLGEAWPMERGKTHLSVTRREYFEKKISQFNVEETVLHSARVKVFLSR
jgi:hypothetical protein